MDSGNGSAYIGQCYVIDTARFGSILFLANDTDISLELDCCESISGDYTLVKANGKTIGRLPEDISCWTTAFIKQGLRDVFDIQVVSITPYEMPDRQLLVRIGVNKISKNEVTASEATSYVYDDDEIPF